MMEILAAASNESQYKGKLSPFTAGSCDDQCKDTCCRNGGGSACVSACGCTGPCTLQDAATCQSDIESAGGALTTAAVDVASAIVDCAGSDAAKCIDCKKSHVVKSKAGDCKA